MASDMKYCYMGRDHGGCLWWQPHDGAPIRGTCHNPEVGEWADYLRHHVHVDTYKGVGCGGFTADHLVIDHGEYFGDARYEKVLPHVAVAHLEADAGSREPLQLYPAMGGPIDLQARRQKCTCGGEWVYALTIHHDYWAEPAVMVRNDAVDIVALMVAMHARGSIHIDDFVAMRDGKLPCQNPVTEETDGP